jgi:hypothetical protein
MNAPPHATFRFSTTILAAALGLQCVWLLLAELSRPKIDHLPTDARSADFAAKWRSDATWAAWIGAGRGDLWAESAFTFADLLWANPSPELTKPLDQAQVRLNRALDYAPHQAGAWLLLAGLASRYQWPNPEPAEALKMSYYTAPNDLRLLPLRLLVAARLEAPGDEEVQQFVRRDLRLLFTHQMKPAVADAYRSASPAGKRLIEQAVAEIDASFLGSIRPGVNKP